MFTRLWTAALAVVLGGLLSLAMGTRAMAATAPAATTTVAAATTGYQAAVNAQMQDLIKTSLKEYFARAGQPQPESVDVKTRADFDLSQPEPTIRKLAIDVNLATDLPAEAVREARQELVHMLRGNGYRFEAATTPADAARPLINLTIDVDAESKEEQRNGLREYAMFAALILGAVACLVLAFNILLIPWRRDEATAPRKGRQRAQQPQRHAPQVAGAGDGPSYAAYSAIDPPIDATPVQTMARDWPAPRPKPSPHEWPAPASTSVLTLPPLPSPAVLESLVKAAQAQKAAQTAGPQAGLPPLLRDPAATRKDPNLV